MPALKKEQAAKMVDLDARIHSLVKRGASRKEIIRALNDIVTAAQRRARRQSVLSKRKEEIATADRIGRLLFFLRRDVPAHNATDADHKIYDLLRNVK
jgi:hypothetical protein